MKNDKGAIALFTLLAMMFFLVFIMVAYNNVAQKGKTQVETTGVLQDAYKADAVSIYKEIEAGELLSQTDERRDILARSEEESATVQASSFDGYYINLLGKCYKIVYELPPT